jgi:hypothetical protein
MSTQAEIIPKKYTARFLSSEIKIDGIDDDSAWSKAAVADSFMQLEPFEGVSPSQITEVRVLYDNNAIYVLAKMFDTNPDSILQELGNRDEGRNINSDAFRFAIDPYNKRENGYVFELSTSGVQTESFDDDISFDAVWESAASINSWGWTAEIKIPYSAIRFPSVNEQVWGIQFARFIRRNREYDQWTLTPKNVQNRMLYWGTMDGINNIDPPIRLSLTPYFSTYVERDPVTDADNNVTYNTNWSYYGGADIKYGINESFTLDMTLLPDFSQVQSDDKVKNLSAFETIYEERRPFFNEGTSLLSKGDLLYTRRIGDTPSLFYDVPGMLNEGETIEKNPDKAKLVNSTKISGRTQGGLGIGFLNAVTGNTYAEVKNASGSKRKILTEPLTNFNLFILDQQLKNNCNIFLVNSNVMREGSYRDANVTTVKGRFENKKHQYRLSGAYSTSNIYEWTGGENGDAQKSNLRGEQVKVGIDKISGNSWYGGYYEIADSKYDKNDLGYNFINDYSELNGYFSYNKFNPFWKYFKQGSITFYANRTGRLSSNNVQTDFYTGANFFLLFHSNWSIYTETGVHPQTGKDYYEPRIEGRYFNTPTQGFISLNFTTNYNKKLAFDFGGRAVNHPDIDNVQLGYYIIPRYRVNDRFTITLSNYYDCYKNDLGFALLSDDGTQSFFGRRDITSIENTLTSRYMFKNDMSLSLSARHYWSQGIYDQYYLLQEEGNLLPVSSSPINDNNFNSNYLTVDLVYNWQFAPGSSLLITYKNQMLADDSDVSNGYFNNLSNAFSAPQNNSVSIKILYYFDYLYLSKMFNRKCEM